MLFSVNPRLRVSRVAVAVAVEVAVAVAVENVVAVAVEVALAVYDARAARCSSDHASVTCSRAVRMLPIASRST